MPTVRFGAIIFSLLLSSAGAHAEFTNKSYSYFALGSSLTSYSESLSGFAGSSFKSDFSSTGLTQRSGGYTALSEDGHFGFFIATQSTLLANEDSEKWNANWDDDGDGSKDGKRTVQIDQVSMNQGGLDLLAVYHLKNGYFVTVGMRYQKLVFSRFDFQSVTDNDNTADYAAFTLANSATYANIVQLINDNGSTVINGTTVTTAAEAAELIKFSPEALTPVVSEDLTTFSVVGGFGYDSFFIDNTPGLRYKFDVSMGTPFYVSVLNTNLEGSDRSIAETFSGGIDINGNVSVGYQFNEKISVMASLSYVYSDRDTISTTTAIGQKVSLPNNTFEAIIPEIAFFWAF
ncbi:MAG: hypothetical protein RPR98_01725 [Bermanella sp.]|jgi:hypothetical protein